jgi:hypothetical protein
MRQHQKGLACNMSLLTRTENMSLLDMGLRRIGNMIDPNAIPLPRAYDIHGISLLMHMILTHRKCEQAGGIDGDHHRAYETYMDHKRWVHQSL